MLPIKNKLAALGEGIAVFLLVAAAFYALRQVESIRTWERAVFGSRLVVEYAALLLFTPLYLLVTRRSPAGYGVAVRPVRYHLGIFAAAFLPVFLLSVALNWIQWQTWPGALLASALVLALLFLTAWMLRRKPDGSSPPPVLYGLAPLPLAAPLLAYNQTGQVLLNLGYAYLLIAPAEELFFRGFLQSRFNTAFGQPFCTQGIRWGWGLLISALLFGLWHAAVNPASPTAWQQALWTAFAGLVFGIVREKSSSVAAPALLHGVLNYGPQALLFDLFF